jgi:hypothetical protein
MMLTADRVRDLFKECLTDEPKGVRVDGIVNAAQLDVTGHEDEIGQLLAELPDTFHYNGGAGWSFLNSCEDRHGNLWTGEHLTMERLLLLGLAADKARWCLPKHMWDAFPGNMPYFAVAPEGFPPPIPGADDWYRR